MSIVQLSRFFLCSFSSDSFYILSKALSFVKNFFNFFHFLFCEAFSQRVSSYIISFVSVFVKNFFDFFQKNPPLFFDKETFLPFVPIFCPNRLSFCGIRSICANRSRLQTYPKSRRLHGGKRTVFLRFSHLSYSRCRIRSYLCCPKARPDIPKAHD